MRLLYSIGIHLFGFGIYLFSFWNKKAKERYNGSISWEREIDKLTHEKKPPIWLHASSMGEFEQGRPIIEKLKTKYPDYPIIVSFFSPSGYNYGKNYKEADTVFYLPIDTRKNAKKLILKISPHLVIFVKYEYWYNLMNELYEKNIPFFYVSAIFRKNQYHFKFLGSWFAEQLKKANHFMVQNNESKKLLKSIGVKNVTITGDSRFDRVKTIALAPKSLDFINQFKDGNQLFVGGSTWPKDHQMIAELANLQIKNCKYLIAPHNIKKDEISDLQKKLEVKSIRFSDWQKEKTDLSLYSVFILDTIGLLMDAYSYADIAYVGGAFDTDGIHNLLEAAVFGIPVLYGPKTEKYIEAIELEECGGGVVVKDKKEFIQKTSLFLNEDTERKSLGKASKDYVFDKPSACDASIGVIESFFD